MDIFFSSGVFFVSAMPSAASPTSSVVSSSAGAANGTASDGDDAHAVAASLRTYLSDKLSAMEAVESKMRQQATAAVADIALHTEELKKKADAIKRELRDNVLVRLEYRRGEMDAAKKVVTGLQV